MLHYALLSDQQLDPRRQSRQSRADWLASPAVGGMRQTLDCVQASYMTRDVFARCLICLLILSCLQCRVGDAEEGHTHSCRAIRASLLSLSLYSLDCIVTRRSIGLGALNQKLRRRLHAEIR